VAEQVISSVDSTAIRVKSGLLSLAPTFWATFDVTSIDISLLLRSFLSIQGVLYIFDYLYRILQTIQCLARFWGRGVVKLPKIDIRSKHDYRDDLKSPWFVYIQQMITILPLIWAQLLMCLAFLIVVIWLIAGNFSPFSISRSLSASLLASA
jgi:hypothetical protein